MRGDSFARQRGTRQMEDSKTKSFARQTAERGQFIPDVGATLSTLNGSFGADPHQILSADQVGSDQYGFHDVYQVNTKLRSGSYGTVYTCHHKSDPSNPYAVKILDRARLKEKDNANVVREMAIMRELRSLDHVVSLIDFFQDERQLYMVQILANGGDVFDALGRRNNYTESDARELAHILLKTVGALHRRCVVHRDLKPENLLLRYKDDDTSILLADFGFARHVPHDGWCQTRCGTPAFVAPEILLGIPYRMSADLWSIGCLLYMLLGGYPPFQGKNHRELFCKIRAGDYVFHESVFGTTSVEAKTMISGLLTVGVDTRTSTQNALESDWFKRVSKETLRANDLSTRALPGFKQFAAQRRWKAAKTAISWAATQPFWKTDHVTFSEQVTTWDREAIQQQMKDEHILESNDTSFVSSNKPPPRSMVRAVSSRVPNTPMLNIAVPVVKFSDVYQLKRQLRSGSSATVWECVHIHSGEVYAAKVIDRKGLSPRDDENVLTEVAAMQSLSGNRHCVQLLDFYEEPGFFYMVMEYMAGGDLFDRIVSYSAYTEKDARDLTKLLLKAVASIHKAGIAHRDIKPQNLLLLKRDDNTNMKVGDFGFSRRVHTPNSLTSRVGTPTYVAPEILKNIPHDERVDLWSVGVVVFVLLVGYPPFLEDDQAVLFDKVRTGEWSFVEDDWKHISNDAKDLIRGLLNTEPKERWTVEEALRCRWIKQDAFSLSSISLNESMTSIRMRRSRLRTLARTVMWLGNNAAEPPTENVPTQPQPMDIVQEGTDEDLSLSLSLISITDPMAD